MGEQRNLFALPSKFSSFEDFDGKLFPLFFEELVMDNKVTLVLETLKKHGVSLPFCMSCKVFTDSSMPEEFSGLDVYERSDIQRELWKIRIKRMHSAYRELGISASAFDELEELNHGRCLDPEQFAEKVAKYLPGKDSDPSEGLAT